jgi:hypothetical protein
MNIQYILDDYQNRFKNKQIDDKLCEPDLLMNVFNIDSILKTKNMQYWNRELGMCWQKIIIDTFKNHKDYLPAFKNGTEEPCDLIVGDYAIDTKYRIGSGDSGTLKKFRKNALFLQEKNFKPLLLVLRKDNLVKKLRGWDILTDEESFEFILKHSGIDLKKTLMELQGKFLIY